MGKVNYRVMDNNRYPDIITRKGFGTFSIKELEFESFFEIVHYPQKTVIETQIFDKHLSFKLHTIHNEYWELKGVTEDNINVFAKNILTNTIIGNQLTLFSFKDLCFGENEITNFSSAEFPLVGIYDQDFVFDNNAWEVHCSSPKDKLEILRKKSKNWDIQLEGNILKLKKEDATKDQFLTRANNITALLSLALGNDVIFNRQLYYKDEKLVREDWRRKVNSHFGTERCIPDFELSDFIKSTIDSYEKWDEEKKKLFFSTVTYINSSSKGYLEDRLLGISIAWESLAQSWTSKKNNYSNNELDPFKDFLKKTICDFQLPVQYDKDFIKERILKSLEWEKLTESLMNFSDQFKLDQDKLGLDFKSLIKIRNDIAHTGLLRKKYTQNFLSDLIYNHKLGLQVILLLELGYDNLIESQEDKWRTFIKIDELLKPSL